MDRMTLHYHALPITPNSVPVEMVDALGGLHFLCSYGTTAKAQAQIVEPIAESLIFDNGAFSAYQRMMKAGLSEAEIDEIVHAPTHWDGFYEWVEARLYRSTSRAIIPDVIGGSGQVQDALLKEWPFPKRKGIPVYHLHLPPERLLALFEAGYETVALGSSGEFWEVGAPLWFQRMRALKAVLRDAFGEFIPPLHGLRMMDVIETCPVPLASADSSNVGQNHHRGRAKSCGSQQQLFEMTRTTSRTAIEMARRINARQSPGRWANDDEAMELTA